MFNLFLKPELAFAPIKLSTPTIAEVGDRDFVPIVEYNSRVDFAKISTKTGSKRIGKEIYDLTELNLITLGIFGFKHQQGTPKPDIVAYLKKPENEQIIDRHNELISEREIENNND